MRTIQPMQAIPLAAFAAALGATQAAAAEASHTGCWAADEAREAGRPLGGAPVPSRIPIPEGAVFVKVTRTINRPIETVFDYVIDVDLTHIFGPKDGRPGVVSTTIPKGWNTVGQVRVNTSSTGVTNREQLTRVDRPTYFSYCIDQSSVAAANAMIDRTEGAWLFTDNGNGSTSIEWIYSLVPGSPDAARQLSAPGVTGRYQSALDDALGVLKADLEP